MPKKHSAITAFMHETLVLTENTNLARELYNTFRFGVIYRKTKVQLNFLEALFLLEKNKIIILDGKNKEYDFDRFVKKVSKLDKRFWVKYCVFKDFRAKGYIIKTALKFGAEFRVYNKGVKPGEDHARWVVFPVNESEALTWYEFSAKNRVAHSTKKKLLLAIVDGENDITYYEVGWTKI